MKSALFCFVSFLMCSLLLNGFYLKNLFLNIQNERKNTASCDDCLDKIKTAYQNCKGSSNRDQCTIESVSDEYVDCLCDILDIDCSNKVQETAWNMFKTKAEIVKLKGQGIKCKI